MKTLSKAVAVIVTVILAGVIFLGVNYKKHIVSNYFDNKANVTEIEINKYVLELADYYYDRDIDSFSQLFVSKSVYADSPLFRDRVWANPRVNQLYEMQSKYSDLASKWRDNYEE